MKTQTIDKLQLLLPAFMAKDRDELADFVPNKQHATAIVADNSAAEAALVVQGFYHRNINEQQMAKILLVLGYSVHDVATALVKTFDGVGANALIQLLNSNGKINPLEMAKILAELGYTITETSGALVDNYADLSADELVIILKSEGVYPQTSRNEMIEVLLGNKFNLSITLTAINPAYPSIKVLNYSSGGATLTAQPSSQLDAVVFCYHNTRDPARWDWKRTKAAIVPVLAESDIYVTASSDKTGRGLFGIGNAVRWYYDIALFPDTNILYWQIFSLLAYSCGQKATFVNVLAKQKWQSTGIQVNAGNPVTASYKSGLWTVNPNEHGGKRYNSAGVVPTVKAKAGYTLPGENEGALIGRVGQRTFLIGLNAIVPDDVNGELMFCVNDDLDPRYGEGFADNEGEIDVNIVS